MLGERFHWNEGRFGVFCWRSLCCCFGCALHQDIFLSSSYNCAETCELFMWGGNHRCQLGLGDGINRNAPELVKALGGHPVSSVALGNVHTLALLSVFIFSDQKHKFTFFSREWARLCLGRQQQWGAWSRFCKQRSGKFAATCVLLRRQARQICPRWPAFIRSCALCGFLFFPSHEIFSHACLQILESCSHGDPTDTGNLALMERCMTPRLQCWFPHLQENELFPLRSLPQRR